MLNLFVLVTAVAGWSNVSHEIIASVAAQRLSPLAATFVSSAFDLADPTQVASTMVTVSTWADTAESSRLFPSSDQWHYYNAPKDSPGYADHPCGHECLVSALVEQTRIAVTAPAPRDAEYALRFLIHLLGDAHQPLHSGRDADRGGTNICVSFPLDEQKRLDKNGWSSLHLAWDLSIPQFASLKYRDVYAAAEVVLPTGLPGKEHKFPRFTVDEMAEDLLLRMDVGDIDADLFASVQVDDEPSLTGVYGDLVSQMHKLAELTAYPIAEMAALGCRDHNSKCPLDRAYFVRNAVIAEQLLARAGARLAQLLNTIAAARDSVFSPAHAAGGLLIVI